MTVDEASGPPVEVFPDNAPTVNLFIALGGSWRSDMGCPTGIDLSAVTPLVLRAVGISLKDWPEVFQGLRVMESAALDHLNKK